MAAILDGSPSGCSLTPMDAGPVQNWTGTRCRCCAESEDHHGRHLHFETAAEITTIFGSRQLGKSGKDVQISETQTHRLL